MLGNYIQSNNFLNNLIYRKLKTLKRKQLPKLYLKNVWNGEEICQYKNHKNNTYLFFLKKKQYF